MQRFHYLLPAIHTDVNSHGTRQPDRPNEKLLAAAHFGSCSQWYWVLDLEKGELGWRSSCQRDGEGMLTVKNACTPIFVHLQSFVARHTIKEGRTALTKANLIGLLQLH